ncbi:MAG: hypothetical protein HKN79_06105, partial [Flavobacteriales bacterium]|nr:hypothetical protein [Flavobacteriales bacterium]
MRRSISNCAWAVGILLSTSVLAQDVLTIEEAVTGAYSTFAPERVADLEWIPDSDTYSYRKGEGREALIVRGFTDDRPDEVLFDLEKIRDAFLNAGFVQPEEIPPFIWIDSERVLFSFKGQYWEYNTQWKVVAKRISCSRVVQNRELSPQHTNLAGTVGNRVYISDKSNDTIPITDPPEGITHGQAVSRWEFGIDKGLFWSPDGQKLAFYEKDERPVSEYALMDYTTIPAQEAPVRYPMAGQGSEIVKLKVFDLKKNQVIELATEGEPDQYLTSITWALDGKSILVGHLDRSQNNFKLARYNVSTGELAQILFEEKDDAYVEPEQGAYMLPGTKGEFLWFSERDGYNHIYHYDKKGQLLGQVTRGEHVIQRVLHYDEESQELIVLGTGSPIETVAYLVPLDGSSMTRITPESGLHRVKVSDTGKYLIDAYSSMEIPRRTVIRDRSGKVVKTLLDAPDP